jgi:ABC-type uncharacterized transport system permease subunit
MIAQVAFEAALLVLLTWASLLSVRAGLFDVSLDAKFAIGIVAALFAWQFCPEVLRNNLLLAGVFGTLVAVGSAGAIGGVYGWLSARRKLDQIVAGMALNFAIIPLAAWAYGAWYRPWESSDKGIHNLSRQLTDHYADQSAAAWIIAIGVLVASAFLAWAANNTVTGTRLMASGLSSAAAAEAGVDVDDFRAKAAKWSGYCCGLAGALYVYFISPSFTAESTIGRGFLALAITMTARRSVFYVCCLAFALGVLKTLSQTLLRSLLKDRVADSTVGFMADAIPPLLVLVVLALLHIFVKRLLPGLIRRPQVIR